MTDPFTTVATAIPIAPIRFPTRELRPIDPALLEATRKVIPRGPTYPEALLILGKILLRDDGFTPWLSLRKISGQCNKHWSNLPGMDYSITALADWAVSYFVTCGEIRGDDLKVCYQTERNDRMRMPQMQLQFVRLIPGGGVY